MSKRHQANRRRAYGRRQHEVQERRQREDAPDGGAFRFDDDATSTVVERLTFLEGAAGRLRYASAD